MRRNVEPIFRPRHADRHAQRRFVPKQGVLVLQTVAVGVAEDVYAAIVSEGGQFAVGGEAQVVDVGELDGQFLDGEARDQQANGRLARTGQGRGESDTEDQNRKEIGSHERSLCGPLRTCNAGNRPGQRNLKSSHG